jgi:hypothetical protein
MTDLGSWSVIDAVVAGGRDAGKAHRRERVYAVRHPTAGVRYACGQCHDTYATLGGADGHRAKEHPFPRGGDRREIVTVDPRKVVAEQQPEPQPRQMTFDEVGLDTVGPHIAEGVAAIVASRQGLREQVKRLQAENSELRAALAGIAVIIDSTRGETST